MTKKPTPTTAALLAKRPPNAETPAKLTEAGLTAVEELAARGLSVRHISVALGLQRDALENTIREDPAVADAFERGRRVVAEEVVGLLLKAARAGNITAAIFAAKNLAGWSDNGPRDGSATAAVQVNIQIPPPMTQDEFREVIEGTKPEPTEEKKVVR